MATRYNTVPVSTLPSYRQHLPRHQPPSYVVVESSLPRRPLWYDSIDSNPSYDSFRSVDDSPKRPYTKLTPPSTVRTSSPPQYPPTNIRYTAAATDAALPDTITYTYIQPARNPSLSEDSSVEEVAQSRSYAKLSTEKERRRRRSRDLDGPQDKYKHGRITDHWSESRRAKSDSRRQEREFKHHESRPRSRRSYDEETDDEYPSTCKLSLDTFTDVIASVAVTAAAVAVALVSVDKSNDMVSEDEKANSHKGRRSSTKSTSSRSSYEDLAEPCSLFPKESTPLTPPRSNSSSRSASPLISETDPSPPKAKASRPKSSSSKTKSSSSAPQSNPYPSLCTPKRSTYSFLKALTPSTPLSPFEKAQLDLSLYNKWWKEVQSKPPRTTPVLKDLPFYSTNEEDWRLNAHKFFCLAFGLRPVVIPRPDGPSVLTFSVPSTTNSSSSSSPSTALPSTKTKPTSSPSASPLHALRAQLKLEKVRWHEDKLRHFFSEKFARDERCKAVWGVIIDLKSEVERMLGGTL